MSAEQKCRICGCVDERPCATAAGSCYWVEPDLCSAPGCAGKEYAAGRIKITDETRGSMLQDVMLDLRVGQAMMIVGALQLAFRHPEFSQTKTAEKFLKSWVASVIETVSLTAQIKFILEQGWAAPSKPKGKRDADREGAARLHAGARVLPEGPPGRQQNGPSWRTALKTDSDANRTYQ